MLARVITDYKQKKNVLRRIWYNQYKEDDNFDEKGSSMNEHTLTSVAEPNNRISVNVQKIEGTSYNSWHEIDDWFRIHWEAWRESVLVKF